MYLDILSSELTAIGLLLSCFLSTHFIIPINATVIPATKPIISFCAGSEHACAVFDNYKMKCWGSGVNIGASTDYGKTALTIGDNIPYFDAGNGILINKVTCLDKGLCILLGNGNIKCVGKNNSGEPGLGVTTTPIGESTGYIGDSLPVVDLGDGVIVTSITSGYYHTCILESPGKVKCFGGNASGQLGYGDTKDRGTSPYDLGSNLTYVSLGSGVEVASIHSGSTAQHTCTILSAPVANAQRIKCWGSGTFYQLGYGNNNYKGTLSTHMGDNLPLVDLGTESKVKQLGISESFTCALRVDDVLKCWGYSDRGQLSTGNGNTITSTGDSMPSVGIDSGNIVKLLAVGNGHTCIVYDDLLTLKCVGWNQKGQLGQGDNINKGNTPTTKIPDIPAVALGTGSLKISSIHCSKSSTCAVFLDSSVKCFGLNDIGQLGVGSILDVGDQGGEMGSNLKFTELFSPTTSPTNTPSNAPTSSPTLTPTKLPSKVPTTNPSASPSKAPTVPTSLPSISPTKKPSNSPTNAPTKAPTSKPTISPSKVPTTPPSLGTTNAPTSSPTQSCQYDKSKLCKKDLKCVWGKVNGKKGCALLDCTALDKGACKKEKKRCTFNKGTKSCTPKF